MIKIPSGYVKVDTLSQKASSASKLVEAASKEKEDSLQKLVLDIQISTNLADQHWLNDDVAQACSLMKKVKTAQQEYLQILRVMEGINAFQTHLTYGLVDLKTAKEDLDEIVSVPWEPEQCQDSDSELLSQLEEKKFYPRLFPLLGGGVNIFYSDQPPVSSSHHNAKTSQKKIAVARNKVTTPIRPVIRAG